MFPRTWHVKPATLLPDDETLVAVRLTWWENVLDDWRRFGWRVAVWNWVCDWLEPTGL